MPMSGASCQARTRSVRDRDLSGRASAALSQAGWTPGVIQFTAIWEIVGLNVRVPDMVTWRPARADGRLPRRAHVVRRSDRTAIGHADQCSKPRALALHDYAERLGRAEIRDLPNGTYHFTDHIDGLGDDPEPIVIALAVTIGDEAISVDFTGTSPQVKGGLNTPLPFTKASVYTAIRSVMQSDIPNCHGFERVVSVTAPKGTLVNSVHPAPCGARGITGYRVIDAMFGALAQAVPDRVTADGMGGSTVPTFAGWHEGRAFVFTETVMGTWGATSAHDGQVGVPHMGANQANVPVEMIEAAYPLRILRYGIVPDTGGAGRHRGGNALIREYEYLGESEGLLSLRSDKRRFRPHGLFGGAEGSAPVNLLIRDGRATELPVLLTRPHALRKGDVFRHISPSGGGFGPAAERVPEDVRADLEAGLLSSTAAETDYGLSPTGRERRLPRREAEMTRLKACALADDKPVKPIL
jgi:N-methylhydantoinase B